LLKENQVGDTITHGQKDLVIKAIQGFENVKPNGFPLGMLPQ